LKILFLCHDPPAPITNGGVIDMLGMCQALHDLGHIVELVYTMSDPTFAVDHARLDLACTTHRSVLRNGGLRSLLSTLPYQIASRRALMTLHFGEPYDVIIASDHCAGAALNPSLRARHWIWRRNNDEVSYAHRMAAQSSNPLIKLFFLKESQLFSNWYRRMDRCATQVWYVSTQELSRDAARDRKTLASGYPQRLLVPAALGGKGIQPLPLEHFQQPRVLYFGSMTIPINEASVRWYITHVHPRVREIVPAYQLIIAGRVTAALSAWLDEQAKKAYFVFLPNPVDSDKVYAQAAILIDPLAHDAGIKLKIVEAVRRGFAVVCAPESLAGSGLEAGAHALVATGAQPFADCVIKLLLNPDYSAQIASAAQKKIRQHFDIHSALKDALTLLPSAQPARRTV
jgi:polysaccharide biosynthesis protein PslH